MLPVLSTARLNPNTRRRYGVNVELEPLMFVGMAGSAPDVSEPARAQLLGNHHLVTGLRWMRLGRMDGHGVRPPGAGRSRG